MKLLLKKVRIMTFLRNPTKIKWDNKNEPTFENILHYSRLQADKPDSKLFLSNFTANGILPEQKCPIICIRFFHKFGGTGRVEKCN